MPARAINVLVAVRNVFTLAMLLGALAALTAGCAAKQPCYGLLGIDFASRTAVIFDSCTGVVELQTVPLPSTPRGTES